MPLFGWVAGRVRRRRILYWVYGFFVANLLAFAACFVALPGDAWVARAFYIWLSVFNMIAISVAWSVLVDVFTNAQSRRLFALMAAGASLGGLAGPVLGVLLVKPLGYAGLLVLSAVLLAAAAVAAWRVQRWRDARPLPGDADMLRQRPLGGSPFAGATDVLRSPYLLGIAVFVLLLASVTTFLYFEQARLVEARFPDPVDQTRVFGVIDTLVQTLAIVSQLFITGRVAKSLGVGVLLVTVPLVVAAGFLWLAFAPVFAVLAAVMVVRRAGEYAFVRPGREMLYTVLAPEAKYKAKNFNDTVVYRGADAVSGWVKTGIDLLAQQPAAAMVVGAGIALAWGANGAWLARAQRRMQEPSDA
jgi:AAA family ATP:ADP antiporter